MSTRANIELYDGWEEQNRIGKRIRWRKGAVLYHHCDGYPAWLGPELERKLEQAKKELDDAEFPYWWDSERVGALIVKLSANEEFYRNVPSFQPCLDVHGDTNYLWRVFLGPRDGEYEIQCFKVTWDWDKDQLKGLETVDWRKEAGK